MRILNELDSTCGVSDEELLAALKRRIRKRSAPQNNLAMAFSSKGLKGISVNANKFSPQALAFTRKRLLPRSVETKFHPVGCDTIKSVIDHEMGHQIDYLTRVRTRRFKLSIML